MVNAICPYYLIELGTMSVRSADLSAPLSEKSHRELGAVELNPPLTLTSVLSYYFCAHRFGFDCVKSDYSCTILRCNTCSNFTWGLRGGVLLWLDGSGKAEKSQSRRPRGHLCLSRRLRPAWPFSSFPVTAVCPHLGWRMTVPSVWACESSLILCCHCAQERM